MNYFCLRYVPICNILTTAMNQYIDYLLFLVMIPVCWDDSWRFGLNIKKMSGCLLTSYMRTQYLVLFYIVMNVWPVVYLGRYTSVVSTSLTVKQNRRRAINNILWNWIPTPMSLLSHWIYFFLLTAHISAFNKNSYVNIAVYCRYYYKM